jgi:hypothetical protein
MRTGDEAGCMNRVGLDFNDERWAGLVGGYRTPYDPRPALRSLEERKGVEEAWHELCTELYHQGDVGEASYAAVPHLVRIYEEQGIPDWNTYALAATIEEARQVGKNPDLPTYLCEPYVEAWHRLVRIGIRELETAEDPGLVSCIIAVIAMGKGQFSLGRFAILFDERERREVLNDAGF